MLDKKGTAFSMKDKELVQAWCNKRYVTEEDSRNAISSMSDNSGGYLTCNYHGTAYARLTHLVNCGVEFCWGVDNTAQPVLEDKKFGRAR